MKKAGKRNIPAKSERLGWAPLKEAAPFKVTPDMVKGRVIDASEINAWQTRMNVKKDSLLVP